MSTGFIIKYSDIYKLEQKYKSNLDELMTSVDSCSSAIETFINDDRYTGVSALAIKNYLADVHLTLLASIKIIAQNMLDNYAIYKASYYSVDNSTNFILSETLLNAFKSTMNDKLNTVLDSEESINSALSQVADLFSCAKPTTTQLTDTHLGISTEIQNLIDGVTLLESQTVTTLQSSAELLIEYLQRSIADAGAASGSMLSYQPNTFFTNPSVYSLANFCEESYLQHQENAEVFQEIWDTEAALAKAASDRETEGIWKAVGGGLLIVGGVVCIVATWGAATPIVAAGLVAGGGTVIFGTADAIEGASDIYYGTSGDIDSTSINGLRDGLFRGNVKAYQTVENVFAFTASALVPIGAASQAGTLTFRSASVAVGKLAISTAAGNGAASITMDLTGSRAASMAVGMVTSTATGYGLNAIDYRYGVSGPGKYSAFGNMSEEDGIRYDAYWKYQEALERGEFKRGTIYDGWYNPDGTMNYPDNWGAIPGTETMVTLGENGVIEVGRYGTPTDSSAYVTEVGVSADRLALPPNTDPNNYIRYQINGSIPDVERAVVAPWVGDKGLGIQYKLPHPIKWYVQRGILIEITN